MTIDGDVFLRARTYDPVTSQFLSTDPIAGRIGTTVGDSPYHYANNNPISYSDPSGMSPWDGIGDVWNAGWKWVGDTTSDVLGAVADWAIPKLMAMKRATGEFLYDYRYWVAGAITIGAGIACGIVTAGLAAALCAGAVGGLSYGGLSAAENCLGEDISGIDCAKTAAWDGLKAAAIDIALPAGFVRARGLVALSSEPFPECSSNLLIWASGATAPGERTGRWRRPDAGHQEPRCGSGFC